MENQTPDGPMEPVVPPNPETNSVANETSGNGQGNTNTNTNRQQRHRNRRGMNRNNLRSREGFFMHYLFVTLSVRYASYFKPTARRLIEFFTLIKAVSMLCLLIYVHLTFVKESGTCLDHVDEIWPRSGVLKVQVEPNSSLPPYQYFFAKANSDSWATSFSTDPYQAVFKYSLQLGRDGLPRIFKTQPTTPNDALRRAKSVFGLKTEDQCPVIDFTQFMKQEAREMLKKRFSETAPDIHFIHPENKEDIPRWVLIDPSISDTVAELKMLQMQQMSGFNVGPQPIREYYAIEYSAEFGYLRLSAVTRHKLGVPVLVVTLDPLRDACFGDGTKRWMLDTFFGYDDLVMSSIKRLAEKDNKQGGGYLRNLVTGEHFKFITLWVSHASYLLAFIVMLVFTLVVTMLLRYSYHQIFVFMVELLHILDTDATPIFPAAPMLTIILALVGTEEIMTEFFHDSTLAFYVILSIWIADQFDAICMHTLISRRHWVRFFFLYHFAFYAYHYRFNGQFSDLALFTSWLFIQHSMFYFLHHYEIPAIQRQIRLRQILFHSNNNTPNTPPSPTSSSEDNSSRPEDNNPPEPEDNNNNDENRDAGNAGSDEATGGESSSQAEQPPPASNEDHSNDLDSMDSCQNTPERDISISPQVHSGYETLHLLSDAETLNCEMNEIFEDNSILKESETVPLWDDFEPDIDRNAIGFSKYCNLIIMLFLILIPLIIVFTLGIQMLNQNRFGARFDVNDFDRVAGIVR